MMSDIVAGTLKLKSYYTEENQNLEMKTGNQLSVHLSLASGDF